MAYQTSRLSEESVGPIRGVTESASTVLGDAFDLAELQTQLFKADAKSCASRAKAPLVAVIVAVALLLASLPVVALGLASLVSWMLEWPVWVAQLLVGGLLAALGIGLAYWAVMRLRSSLDAFEATGREASANIKWLRQTVTRSFASSD